MLLHRWSRFAEITKTQRRFLIQRDRPDFRLTGRRAARSVGSCLGSTPSGAAIVQADWRMVGETVRCVFRSGSVRILRMRII